jgi:predicted SAM-dependent methyltransferase
VLRGKKSQVNNKRSFRNPYLQIGCGPCANDKFVNLDYFWQPGVDIVWDINKRLPFGNNRFKGIYTEHCLEHFDLKRLANILKEFYRLLDQEGVLRIVVPDLRKYVVAYWNRINGKAGQDNSLSTAQDFNRVFYVGHERMVQNKWLNNGHHYIHDYESMHLALTEAGFGQTKEWRFGEGKEKALVIDQSERQWESLYVEAYK